MKFRIYTLLPLLFVINMACPACGTGNGDDEEEPQTGEFPIPWPEGGEIITDGREDEGTTGYITLQYDAGRHEEVVEFYDDYADGNGWNRSEVGQGEVPTVNYMNLMDGLNISVGPPGSQIADAVLVTLTAS